MRENMQCFPETGLIHLLWWSPGQPFSWRWYNFFPFYGWKKKSIMYKHYMFNPCICVCTSRLVPFLSYCDYCCNRHWCSSICDMLTGIPLSKYLGKVYLDCMVVWVLAFWGNPILVSVGARLIFILPTACECSFLSTSSPAFIGMFLTIVILTGENRVSVEFRCAFLWG